MITLKAATNKPALLSHKCIHMCGSGGESLGIMCSSCGLKLASPVIDYALYLSAFAFQVMTKQLYTPSQKIKPCRKKKHTFIFRSQIFVVQVISEVLGSFFQV